MNQQMLDLYTDSLTVSFSYTTATGLSKMLNEEINHHKVTRFLSGSEFTSKDLWYQVKSVIRKIETDEAILVRDDTVEEKKWTDENELIAWHFDHSTNKMVKGINMLNTHYISQGYAVPLGYELITKPI